MKKITGLLLNTLEYLVIAGSLMVSKNSDEQVMTIDANFHFRSRDQSFGNQIFIRCRKTGEKISPEV